MNIITDSGCIIAKNRITAADLEELTALEKVCRDEGIHLKLELDFKMAVPEGNDGDGLRPSCMWEYFYYSYGRLVSYLGICCFGGSVYELNGMTHPDYRRRGIFGRLYAHALAECKRAGKKKLLLLADGNSQAGIGFMEAVGGIPAFSEHRMELESQNFHADVEKAPDITAKVSLREAGEEDRELIREYDRLLYSEPDADTEEEPVWDFIKNTYLIEKDGAVLGKIRIDYQENEAFLYGFGILPQYRGKGYGKAALREALLTVFRKGAKKAALDVETKNDRALSIYTGNGFQTVSCMRYYEVVI